MVNRKIRNCLSWQLNFYEMDTLFDPQLLTITLILSMSD